ncbi:MAG: hypothetical protein V7609_208 [Verrucomicrobiota bacterium]
MDFAGAILVRYMRALFLVGFCLILTGCMKKTDLGAVPPLTRVVVSSSESLNSSFPPRPLENAKASAVVAFINGHRFDWTRAIGVGFGVPSPVCYVHLYEGDRYLGYFGVGAAVLPGSSAFFEVQLGKLYARKRVTRSEANRFLDLIGIGGELSGNMDNEVRQQIANQPAKSRAAGFIEPRGKFQPGDRVRVRVTQAEGTVCLRTKFFREDLYFVTLPESYYVFDATAERAQRDAAHAANVAWAQEWARSHSATVADFPEYEPRPWHEEGPFYESDLELISNRPSQALQRTAK